MTIKGIIATKDKDIGGFFVRRALPSVKQQMVGPWIFFDHFGPVQFSAGEGINVRPHPHINLATVSYLFEGEILHRDALGNIQAIRPGDINLMVTGSGLVHSERERDEVHQREHHLHGLQLWLALPEVDEEIDPAFYHYANADIPTTEIDGVKIRVMMGEAYDLISPVLTFAQTLYVEAKINAGRQLVMPLSPELAIYIVSGSLLIDGKKISEHNMVVLESNKKVTVSAEEETQIAIIGGETLGHRFIEWNFVSSRKERIEQAKADWQAGRFATIPGDDKEFIPLP